MSCRRTLFSAWSHTRCLGGRTEMHPLRNERKEHIYWKNWGTPEKRFVVQHLGSMPSGVSSICKKHFLEAQRHHSTPNFIQKWTGTQSSGAKPKQKCIHPSVYSQCVTNLLNPHLSQLISTNQHLGQNCQMTNNFCFAKNATMTCTRYSTLQHPVHLVVLFQRKAPVGIPVSYTHLTLPTIYSV